jgi:hypothetical protein
MAEDKPGTPTLPEPPAPPTTPPEPPARPPLEIKRGEITFTAETSMNSPRASQLMLGAAVLSAGGYAPQEHRGGRKSSGDLVWNETLRRLYIGRGIPETLKEFSEQLSEWLKDQVDETMKQVPQLGPERAARAMNVLWNAWRRCRGCKPDSWKAG